jgi:hypothetical protein
MRVVPPIRYRDREREWRELAEADFASDAYRPKTPREVIYAAEWWVVLVLGSWLIVLLLVKAVLWALGGNR